MCIYICIYIFLFIHTHAGMSMAAFFRTSSPTPPHPSPAEDTYMPEPGCCIARIREALRGGQLANTSRGRLH